MLSYSDRWSAKAFRAATQQSYPSNCYCNSVIELQLQFIHRIALAYRRSKWGFRCRLVCCLRDGPGLPARHAAHHRGEPRAGGRQGPQPVLATQYSKQYSWPHISTIRQLLHVPMMFSVVRCGWCNSWRQLRHCVTPSSYPALQLFRRSQLHQGGKQNFIASNQFRSQVFVTNI